MAFETIHRPLFTESREVYFPNNESLSASYNGAFCKVGFMLKTVSIGGKCIWIALNHLVLKTGTLTVSFNY